ncbi:sulfur carrier protein [Saccharopolyspora lacisalsi]|uniref:Sulfur carrier protein n=1 Tax=Halosaccharopolyspora lacisalsi TaxID=1000566 RepID=A0A839E187_9PSEU|nr:sulfur carrier protein ThiS [Halosaccharopolyspora lacisalsi]MBA8826669.1 sulfur carrier protein [Halosaccharopolyspora lacisalsi]
MTITINGQQRRIEESTTLADVLEEFGTPARGVAVAVDGAVVPRASWPRTQLRPEATVEILTAVQGG